MRILGKLLLAMGIALGTVTAAIVAATKGFSGMRFIGYEGFVVYVAPTVATATSAALILSGALILRSRATTRQQH